MSGQRPQPDDRGSATIWAVGGIAVLFLVTTMILAVGAVIQTRHRATGAADLAALAAAVGAPDGQPAACAQARWVADRMRVHLTDCRIVGWNALVEVSSALPGELSGLGQVTAHSMAGPAAPDDRSGPMRTDHADREPVTAG